MGGISFTSDTSPAGAVIFVVGWDTGNKGQLF
ncbi:MAG: hypothetical protein JWR54_2025 [Mucilaginibacter sp.]|nr:hypothetical protein [Mucilaginibacter sp.]